MQVPMLDLKREYEYMKAEIDAAFSACLQHQQWILGPQVKELESRVGQYLKTRHCIGVSSGTEALVISLRALALKLKNREFFDKADQIITTPFTFVATASSILRSGATPVFVDIDPRTFNIDPDKLREYLKDNASKVVGILPVHLYGQACSMDAILDIAKKHNLFVLEDSCQAFGARWKGQLLGSLGDAAAFSFFPSKNLGGFGDAGLISTNDEEIARIAGMLLQHGGRDKYNIEHLGYNARLDTLQAAVLLVRLNYIDEFNRKRRALAAAYGEELSSVPGVVCPNAADNGQHIYHQYTIRVKNARRDSLHEHLVKKGISAMVYYPFPLNKMKVFSTACITGTPLANAEAASSEVLSLPVEPLQHKEELEYVTESIKEFFAV